MGEVLIKAEGVSKKFAKDLKKSLYYGVLDLISGISGKEQVRNLRKDEFWAVRDLNFEVRRGECLGLIGHNGAGKSTLLKMLNGLISPDEGTISMTGKIGALIELGAGFNPILTGKENIYNNAAVIGFSKQEIDANLDTIIAFSELEDFINMPVQNYSSGMKVRLGFAIAAQMQPDILLIDEVLAVGDLGFILKCFKKIDQLLPNTALIFVSHSMPMVARICNQIVLMDHGKVEYQGFEMAEGIGKYYAKFTNNDNSIMFDDGVLELSNYEINVDETDTIKRGEDLFLELNFKINQPLEFVPLIYLEFRDKEQRPIAGVVVNEAQTSIVGNTLKYDITIKNILFSLGIYSIDLSIQNYIGKTPMLRINNFITFKVTSKTQMWVPVELESECKIYNS
jgi:lipopolysaccharide transport system ATP-binding protein